LLAQTALAPDDNGHIALFEKSSAREVAFSIVGPYVNDESGIRPI
jgi:hypothetical protein